jgi:hypothetical protein
MNSDDLIEMVPVDEHDPRIEGAIAELRELIASHYPDATFDVRRGEDPYGIHLIPTVDVEDLDEVAAVFMPRLIDMQSDEGLPIFVFPTVTPERLRAYLRDEKAKMSPLEPAEPVPSLTT